MFEIKLDFDEGGFERALNEAVKESIGASVRKAVAPVVCEEHGDEKPANIRADLRDEQLSVHVDWCCPEGEQRILDAITQELTKD